MKRTGARLSFAAVIVIASAAGSALAGEGSSDRWFEHGMTWYEHPCSRADLAVFGTYASWDTPENRLNYEITKQDPSRCAGLFPVPPASERNSAQPAAPQHSSAQSSQDGRRELSTSGSNR